MILDENGNDVYDNGYAKWIPGYLDSVTGNFIPKDSSHDGNGELKDNIEKNGISGFLYQVADRRNNNEIDDARAQKIYAAPCTCPHCLQDYTSRTYTKSPIRSFRTGIDRSNQILSKELIYQLDESKLIGFSDSREDAAKQALGIEKEHYRDMVRMLFIECVEETKTIVDDVKKYIEKRQCQEPNIDKEDLVGEVSIEFPQVDSGAIAEAILFGKTKILKKYTNSVITLSDLVGPKDTIGSLVRKLLKKGINPAGEAYKYQWFEHENQNVRNLYHWSEAYDFTTLTFGNTPFLTEECKKEIKRQLISAIFANSFGKYMGVSVLDAGIGYMCGPQSDVVKNSNEYNRLRNILPQDIDVYEFVDAFIRILGDNYYYPSNDDMNAYDGNDYDNLKAAVKRHIRNFYGHRYQANQDDELNLGNALMEYLKKHKRVSEYDSENLA